MALAVAINVLGRTSAFLRDRSGAQRKPDGHCRNISTDKAALEEALKRASGTWGGHQAVRPFHYRRPD
jgi:hypothetical protein